jgi:flagella basal body P-ring formation protein FlgA
VRNLNSKRVVEGVVLEAGIVEVAAGRPTAMNR